MTDLHCKCGRVLPRFTAELPQSEPVRAGRFVRAWAWLKKLLNT